MKEHIRQKRSMTQGRIFFTSKDMAVAKHDEYVVNARAKREGQSYAGVQQHHCSCGNEGCWITINKKTQMPH